MLSTHLMHLSTKQFVTVVPFTPLFGAGVVPVVVGVVGLAEVAAAESAGDDEVGSSCEKTGLINAEATMSNLKTHQT